MGINAKIERNTIIVKIGSKDFFIPPSIDGGTAFVSGEVIDCGDAIFNIGFIFWINGGN